MSERPKPFSSAWYSAPEIPPDPPKRINRRTRERLVAGLSWLPGERISRVIVLAIFVFGSFWLASPAGEAQHQVAFLRDETPAPGLVFDNVPQDHAQASISTDAFTVTEDETDNPNASGVATDGTPEGPKLSLNLPQKSQAQDGSLLPQNRILLFYGFPGNAKMGILGEYDMDRLLELMREQAAAYEAVDPSRPVKIGFEMIASVAQDSPQNDGSWLLDAPSSLLDTYADFAAENDVLLFFDAQIGRRTVSTEVEGLRPWLERPHVHLALDPEFAMKEGQVPGDHIGQVDAADVTWTQQYLADLSRELGIPPKVLIVHQFKHQMIQNKDKISPVAGVQLVIDMDGFGPPDLKHGTYAAVISDQPVEFNGIKLFYTQDKPLMEPDEVLELDPSPDVIIYQ